MQACFAVVEAISYSSDSNPSLGTSTCHGCGPKKTKKKKTKKFQFYSCAGFCLSHLEPLLLGTVRCHRQPLTWGGTRSDRLANIIFLSGRREEQGKACTFGGHSTPGLWSQPALPLTGPLTLTSHLSLSCFICELGVMREPASLDCWNSK